MNHVNLPTNAKKRQYKAATMDAGMEAKTAPNLPASSFEIRTCNVTCLYINRWIWVFSYRVPLTN